MRRVPLLAITLLVSLNALACMRAPEPGESAGGQYLVFDLIVFLAMVVPLALTVFAWWKLLKQPGPNPAGLSRILLALVSASLVAFYVVSALEMTDRVTVGDVASFAIANGSFCLGLGFLSSMLSYWKRYRYAIAPSLCLFCLWLMVGCMH